jgi:hypothetical protein
MAMRGRATVVVTDQTTILTMRAHAEKSAVDQ